MTGARFILNSRYFHVAKPGEKSNKFALCKEHIANLVEYCATRETVDYNIIDASENLPVTEKQKDIINKLLDIFDKESNSTATYTEYNDFQSAPNRKSASELISRLSSEILTDTASDNDARNTANEAVKIVKSYDPNTRPASQKQKDTIEELLEKIKFKNEEDLPFEYYDYEENPTVQNASQLISRLSEIAMMDGGILGANGAANLIEYAAMRPSVYKVGEHGLFSSENNVDLNKAKEEITTHNGNVWTDVLSLRREDADRLGYDTQYPWKNLIMAHIDDIAEQHQIPTNNLRWYAAMHNTGHHPHIHLFVFSKDPKDGFLSKNGITKLKSELANDIFKDELKYAYQQKDKYEKELKQRAEKTLDNILSHKSAGFSEEKIKELANKMLTLADKIPDTGKNVYGYAKKDIKILVNEIEKSLVNDNPLLSELYRSWCEQQINIYNLYLNNPEPIPIENNEKFITIKNYILSKAKDIKEGNFFTKQSDDITQTTIYIPTNNNDISYNTHAENNYKTQIEETFHFFEPQNSEFNSNTSTISNSYKKNDDFKALYTLANDLTQRNGDICRKLADCYYYGSNTDKNLLSAQMWYGIAADNYKDSIASYKLGQMYLYGTKETEIDIDLGHYYCKQAFFLLQGEVENSEFFYNLEQDKSELYYTSKASRSDAYKEYLIGRMYLKGEGVEQDYHKSYMSFELSAEHGYAHADYYIGNQYYYGLGFEQNFEEAYNYYEKASTAGDKYATYRIGKMYLKGEGININIQEAECCFLEAKENVPLANYDLAKLYEENRDIFFNVEKDDIYNLYHNALTFMIEQDENDIQDAFNEIRIANMYLYGKGTTINIPEAIKWLEKAAKQENPDAAYQLGYLYSSDKYDITDTKKSNEYYASAIQGYEKAEKKNDNATAEYRIGLHYLNGLGVEKNIDKSVLWLEKATLNGSSSAAYKLGGLYEDGVEVPQDINKALLYYQISAELENPYAHYKLGKFDLENNNISNAIEHFELAANKNISHACYILGQLYSSEKYGVIDDSKANLYYSKALQQYIADYSENSDGFTAYRIGQMYLNGLGVEKNIKDSIVWFTKSANQENPDAAYQLGYIYKENKNDKLSNKYFNDALSLYLKEFEKCPENGVLALRIGTFYHYGPGIERNIDKAIEWYIKAVELGNANAEQKINQAEQEQKTAIINIVSTACHFGKILNTETMAAFKQRYTSDSKLLKKEKIQKINSGHAVSDNMQDFDY